MLSPLAYSHLCDASLCDVSQVKVFLLVNFGLLGIRLLSAAEDKEGQLYGDILNWFCVTPYALRTLLLLKKVKGNRGEEIHALV